MQAITSRTINVVFFSCLVVIGFNGCKNNELNESTVEIAEIEYSMVPKNNFGSLRGRLIDPTNSLYQHSAFNYWKESKFKLFFVDTVYYDASLFVFSVRVEPPFNEKHSLFLFSERGDSIVDCLEVANILANEGTEFKKNVAIKRSESESLYDILIKSEHYSILTVSEDSTIQLSHDTTYTLTLNRSGYYKNNLIK